MIVNWFCVISHSLGNQHKDVVNEWRALRPQASSVDRLAQYCPFRVGVS
jgi:hypothetical protein